MAEEIEIPLASTDKYEEALAKARFEYKENPCATGSEKRLLEIIFPELKESEDERIRGGLLRHFKNKTKPYWNEIAVKDIVAWLEKQKGVEAEIEKAYKNADAIQYEKGFEDGVASVKPAEWRPISECGDIPDGHYVVGAFRFGDFRLGIMCNGAFVDPNGNRAEQPKEVFYIPNADEKLKYEKIMESDPDAIEKTPKQDYSGLNDFERAIHRGFLCAGVENVPVSIIKQTAEEALKRIPAEWSEEDETNGWTGVDLGRYLSCLQRLGTGNPQQPETINSKWFKEHCRPRPHWKPSEIDMKYLDLAIVLAEADKSYNLADGLKRLKGNLKKL